MNIVEKYRNKFMLKKQQPIFKDNLFCLSFQLYKLDETYKEWNDITDFIINQNSCFIKSLLGEDLIKQQIIDYLKIQEDIFDRIEFASYLRNDSLLEITLEYE